MSYKHIPRKRFGQNFLINQQIIADIIAIVNPATGQDIVEIGPGQGAITQGLITSKANIFAIELDRDLAGMLSEQFSKHKNFKLYNADILEFDLHNLINHKTKQKLRLVGNLPYNISSPLLFKLFTNIDIINDMFFMLQREVAERLTATPGCKEYGRMSVMAQYYCDMQIVIDVPPDSFDPAPKVDSSVVYFKSHARQDAKLDPRLLQTVTTNAFNQRRKTISNSLKNLISTQELQQLNIDPTLRAENLLLSDYINITSYLQNK